MAKNQSIEVRMDADGRDQRISFRPDVQVVQRGRHTVLFRADGVKVARIARTADVLLPLLTRGTQRSEMQHTLETSYPNDPAIATKLDRFLFRLKVAGLLNSRKAELESRERWRRWNLLDLDPIADRIAHAVSIVPRLPLNLVFATLTVFSLAGIAIAMSSARRPNFQILVNDTNVWGIAFFLLVIVPIHELAHAVACRAAGVPVLGAGFILHGGIIPGPFVDTSSTYAVGDRWLRFRVPIVGPLVDLWAGGVAAWLLRLRLLGAPMHALVASVMFLSTIFFFLDTNPLLQSDGSRALEALFDDEMARRAAFARAGETMSARRVIWSYRFSCALYVCIVTFLVVMLWAKDR